jgi:CBS domain-containing membrane protein
VLLFCLPASPLAQPWSVVGGNVISGLVGMACVKWLGPSVGVAALAACLAIGAMFALRCLHPPGGAVALTTVVGGASVHAAGFEFVFITVLFNSAVLVACAVLYNNLTGRRYPHVQQLGGARIRTPPRMMCPASAWAFHRTTSMPCCASTARSARHQPR